MKKSYLFLFLLFGMTMLTSCDLGFLSSSNPPQFEVDNQTIEAGQYEDIDWTKYITSIKNESGGELSRKEITDNVDYNTPGSYSVILRVTDESGNYTEKNLIVIVEDTIAPSFNIDDQTIESGQYEDVDWSNYISYEEDNSDGQLFNVEETDGVDYNTPGSYSAIIKVTDESGNYAEKNITITVEDTIAPTFDINNKTIESGEYTEISELITNEQDNSDGQLISYEINGAIDFDSPGEYSLLVRLTDESGNYTDKAVTITVIDTTPPQFEMINPILEVGITNVDWSTFITYKHDNSDGNLSVSVVENNINFNVLGMYTVTIRVTDESGNYTDKEITVTLEDTIAPTFNVNNQTIEAGQYQNIDWTLYITDEADNIGDKLTKSVENDNVDYNTPGSYSVILRVTDESGNYTEKNLIVIVEDTIAPTFNINNQVIEVFEYNDIDWSSYITDANDNSDGKMTKSEIIDNVDYDCVGSYVVKVRVTDQSGNYSEKEITVTVQDTTVPVGYVVEDKPFVFEVGSSIDFTKYFRIDDNRNVEIEESYLDLSQVNLDVPNSFIVTLHYTDASGNVMDPVSVEFTITKEWTDVSYFSYTQINNSTEIMILGYNDNGPKDVVIPYYIDELPVTIIGIDAFKEKGITSVELPNSLVSIRAGAFQHNNLSEVTIPEGIKIIESNTFNTNNISVLNLPDSLEIVEDWAFDCNRLTSFYIPLNLRSITAYAFINWNDIRTFTIDPNNPYLEIVDGVVYTQDMTKVLFGPHDYYNTSLKIPEGVKEIQPLAFFNMGLYSISLPESLEVIGEMAFYRNNLSELSFGPNVYEIGDTTFIFNNIANYNVDPNNNYFLSEDGILFNKTKTEIVAFPQNYHSSSYEIPNYITSIRRAAFRGSNITSVIIPESITVIENYVFADTNLTSVVIPDSVTDIVQSAFRDSKLQSVTIPNSVIHIGYEAFGSNNLTSVTIPASVNQIDLNAFRNNPLIEITILGDETRFNDVWGDIGFPIELMPEE